MNTTRYGTLVLAVAVLFWFAPVATGADKPTLKFHISAPRECLVDQPNVVLIQVTNADTKPTAITSLAVSYTSVKPRTAEVDETEKGADLSAPDGEQFVSLRIIAPMISTNPTRKTLISVPALAAGANYTLSVRLTPYRVGDLEVTIKPAMEPVGSSVVLATARLKVHFDPTRTVEQMLPARTVAGGPVRLPKTLAEVPEVSLEDRYARDIRGEEAFERVTAQIDKIHHVNQGKADAYVAALTRHRPDLRGLPVTMGDDCRLSPERGQQFAKALDRVRGAMNDPAAMATSLPKPGEVQIPAVVAAMSQVLGPESAELNRQAVKYLAGISRTEATQDLARLAIFSEDSEVRKEALAALAGRPEKEVAPTLVRGLEYPWPAVAQRAAEAVVALKRRDLIDTLVASLDRPDPRAPQAGTDERTTVREVVRINHLQNCLLCHPPADPVKAAAVAVQEVGRKSGERPGVLMAPVPLPGQSMFGSYGRLSVPDTLVAFDVTYIRQDFSLSMKVEDAQPWPEMQRFDFVVRTREVTAREAEEVRDLLKRKPGELSPYQEAALLALRRLTGKDAEPTASAWRKALAMK